ncbi:MAG: 3-phosphoshikimate 1-carboxyvinyltransferase [Clostridia bacterium]|nr:3-phosphoshikimate 1-carboxyvinyltransferase [Clostridia bacterium]
MKSTVLNGARKGRVHSISSKSHVHRLLIAAALSESETRIEGVSFSADIEATRRCLDAFLTDTREETDALCVYPRGGIVKNAILDAGESGSTYRFLLPVVCALAADAVFTGAPRLAARPLSPLYEELIRHGASLSPQGAFPLSARGQIAPGEYTLSASVSSQFVSGLLFALPLLPADSVITLSGKIESAPYIDMTLKALDTFSVRIERTENGFFVPGAQRYRSPGVAVAEGDWSNAAFFACLGAFSPAGVVIEGLDPESAQGDRAILDLLARMGAEVSWRGNTLSVKHAPLHGIRVDASQIPDLVPALAVAACAARGKTVIEHAERLRLKESDRIESVFDMIRAFGGQIEKTNDGFVIFGTGALTGGTVNSRNDHRIVMAAATAASICQKPVVIEDAGAVAKSYPAFFEDLNSLEVLS